MKKIIFSILAICAFTFAQAQDSGLKAGVHLDVPMGDASDYTSIGFGGDLAYMFPISEEFQAGLTAGYLHFSGKKYKIEGQDTGYDEDLAFIPIAASAQYSIVENFFIGADLGYAIGVAPSEIDGGFYYLPKVGYQIDLFEVYVGYRGISGDFTYDAGNYGKFKESLSLNAISIGFNYKF